MAEYVPVTFVPDAPGRKIAEFTQLLKRRIWHVAALGLALGGSELLSIYSMAADTKATSFPEWIATLILDRPLALLVSVLAHTAVQVWIPQRRLRLLTVTITVIGIAVLVSALQSTDAWVRTMVYTGFSFFLYSLWVYLVFAGLLVILYEWQMRADHVIEALRETRIAGEIVERQMLESRLNGIKARVDPEFLFAVIARIEALYSEDIDAAERLLEQLIEFLRATLPHSNDAAATLEQEVKLCGAYLVIEKALRLESLSYQTKSDAGAAGSRFPPSILLPLLQSLLVPRAQTARPIHLSVTAEKQPSCVRVELTCHAVTSPPPRDVLESATAALRAFFGGNISVIAKSAPFTGNSICIEVPHVAA